MYSHDKCEKEDEYEVDDGLCLGDSQTSFLLNQSDKGLLESAESDNTEKWRAIGYCSLVAFTAIQMFNPILVRVAHKEGEKRGASFLGSTTVFTSELLKTLLCCFILPVTHRSLRKFFVMLYESFTVNRIETLKVCLPALIFVIQNNLYFFALQRIDATLFSMTYQLRVLTTAIFMMVILDKRFTIVQWIALILSLVGAIVVQLGGHPTHHHHDIVVKHNVVSSMNLGVSDQVAGLTAVLIMCLTNAFGGVYLEAVLKKSGEDIFLQNFRLSLISLPMSGAAVFSDYETIKKHGFFNGWTIYVYIIVLVAAFGGIIVSTVIRYADNVKKGFSQTLALGGTAVVSILLHDSEFSVNLVVGVLLVVLSVALYALSPSKKKKLKAIECYDWEKQLIEEDLSQAKTV